jgi:hypothetical protein
MARRAMGLLGGLALAIGAGAETALSAEPVAIVMSAIGAIDPLLPPRSLIDERARVTLGSDGRLIFVLFGECGLFTASGGTVSFQRHEAKVEGGGLERGVGPCTRAHILGEGHEAAVGGGLPLRSVGSGLRVSVRPQFVLAGPGADRVIGAQLIPEGNEDRRRISMELDDGKLRLSEDMPPLGGLRYTLALDVSSGEQPAPLGISISTETAESSLDVLIVK